MDKNVKYLTNKDWVDNRGVGQKNKHTWFNWNMKSQI